MYKTILVPLDGSKRAEAILLHVEQMARHYDAQVVFMQVVEPTYQFIGPRQAYPGLFEQDLQQRTEEAESYLAIQRRRFRAKDIDARTQVAYGPAVEAILDVAEREGADLIAMASHGRSGLAQVFYGSIAAGVLHRIDRPLLLIRSQDDS